MAHTKGTWFYENEKIIAMPGHDKVARLYKFCESHKDSEHEANAQLIAAAPDLLEMLKELFDEVGSQLASRCNDTKCQVCDRHNALYKKIKDIIRRVSEGGL